jgi:hypothetical protein
MLVVIEMGLVLFFARDIKYKKAPLTGIEPGSPA